MVGHGERKNFKKAHENRGSNRKVKNMKDQWFRAEIKSKKPTYLFYSTDWCLFFLSRFMFFFLLKHVQYVRIMALTEHLMLSDNNSHFNLQSHSIKLLSDHAHAYQSMHC